MNANDRFLSTLGGGFIVHRVSRRKILDNSNGAIICNLDSSLVGTRVLDAVWCARIYAQKNYVFYTFAILNP
uniref:Uncharacterized protein n=1 Tax=Romanomermis culicivorax TaxID=13658 RepID=A0A915I5K8_ROMCU